MQNVGNFSPQHLSGIYRGSECTDRIRKCSSHESTIDGPSAVKSWTLCLYFIQKSTVLALTFYDEVVGRIST